MEALSFFAGWTVVTLTINFTPSYPVTCTHYNPAPAQTDSDPCTGAAGVDLCAAAKTGVRPIALSQDFVSWHGGTPFHYGDTIKLDAEDDSCSGEYVVLDTMNRRWVNRADIFEAAEYDLTRCEGTVRKVR